MKISAFILLATCLNVSARGFGQDQITLTLKNVTLEKAITEVEKVSTYGFIFSKRAFENTKTFDLVVKNASINEVLNICFRDQPLTYAIVEKTIIVKPKTDGDNRKTNSDDKDVLIDVRGKIVNEKNEPVLASITVKGLTVATTTNSNGEFSIKGIDENATLIISGVGIETMEVSLNGRSELNLTTRIRIVEGETVVVKARASTGYYDVDPNRATGSFSVIDNKKLNEQVGTNILRRLDGITPAFLFDNKRQTPNKKTNISVRGLSSINGPQDPLIVVDGFIYEGDINNINPNIVETITILKDASAAAIWGARAGNGVIVITTKRGSFNQGLQIDFNANVIVNSKPDLNYLPQMSSNDYINVEQFLYSKGFFNNNFTNTNRPAITPAVEIFRKASLGQISKTDSAAQIDALKQIDVRDQYNKYFYTNALTQQYALNFQGGSSNNAYNFSAGYDRSLSDVNSQFNKLNIKIGHVYRPIKNLQVNVAAYYTNSKSVSGRPRANNITVNGRQAPYLRFADDYGNPLSVDIAFRGLYTDTIGGGKLLNWKYYPLEDYKHDKTTNNLQELYASVGINYKFTSFLNIDLRYQYQNQQAESVKLQDAESYGARSVINLFSQLNRSTGIVKYIVPLGGVRAVTTSNTQSQTGRAQFNMNKVWKNNELSAILGGEIRQALGWGNGLTTYGYNADPLTFGNVDYTTSFPYQTVGSQFIPGAPTYSSEKISRYISLYTNIAYIFNRKYVLSISARRDGSNVFGAKTNDRWKPLWSTGLSWNFSDESFYKVKFLPELRFRMTYGYAGNVDLSKIPLPIAGYVGSNSYTNFPVGVISQLNNPELRWEKVGTFNVGIDFSLVKQIVYGSIDYYRKEGSDLYGPTPYDYTSFGNSPTIIKNVANMKGNGIEVNLSTINLHGKLTWKTNLLYTYQSNKVEKYFSTNANQLSLLLGDGNAITPVIGKPLYSIAAYKWGGLDASGNPQGYVNGQLSKDYNAIANEAVLKGSDGNLVFLGSALPTHYGALINSFSFNDVTVAINIAYKLGYYFRRESLSYFSLFNNGLGNKEYESRWQKIGDEKITNVPSLVYPNVSGRDGFYNNAEINVLKGDHVRLQYVNLNYTIHSLQKHTQGFKEVNVYVNAANLGILWRANKYQLDPDYPSGLEPTKSWALGVRATFFYDPTLWDPDFYDSYGFIEGFQ